MIRKKSLFVAASLAAVTLATAARATFSSAKDPHVGFSATGPAGLTIVGNTTELNVTDADGKLSLDVPLRNLTTGIDLRDRHMRDKYLEVAKFPDAVLVLDRAAIKAPAAGATLAGDAPAALKLHGQERAVTVHFDATGDASGVAVRGKLRIRMDDYGIAVPSYLGVTVKPDVDVTASFHLDGN